MVGGYYMCFGGSSGFLEKRRQSKLSLAFCSEFVCAYAAHMHSLCASVTAVYLSFFVLGEH
jgi:hypothetical protein